jgi:hypothetical protein
MPEFWHEDAKSVTRQVNTWCQTGTCKKPERQRLAALAARRSLPIQHLAGKAVICRRPVNSAMVIKSKEVACTLRYQWKTLWTMIWLSADDHSFAP